MGHILEVYSGIVARDHYSLSSSSQRKNQISETKPNCEDIKGKVVSRIEYGVIYILIEFDDSDLSALISVGDNCINCVISNDHQNPITRFSSTSREDILLVFPSGMKREWKGKELFKSIVGERIALVPSDQYLFLYVKGGIDYVFDILIDAKSGGEPFLYLSEV